MEIQFKQEHPEATLPARAHSSDAGYDIHCIPWSDRKNAQAGEREVVTETLYFAPFERRLLHTGISIASMPEDYFFKIMPKSSISTLKDDNGDRMGFDIGAGVIDSNYRGEIRVVLINNHSKAQTLPMKKNDKWRAIAQLVLLRCTHPVTISSEWAANATETDRGAGGFGSTGK